MAPGFHHLMHGFISANVSGFHPIDLGIIAKLGEADVASFQVVVKGTDEIRSSDVTTTIDSALFFAADATSVYAFRIYVFFTGGTASDFRFSVEGAQTPTLVRFISQVVVPGGSSFSGTKLTALNTDTTVTILNADVGYLWIEGFIATANADTIGFGWGQQTSIAENTTVLRGSRLEYAKAA